MESKKLTWRQWIILLIGSYCGALALCMRFAMPKLSEAQQATMLSEVVWNLRESLSGTSVNSTLIFGFFVGLGMLVCHMKEETCPPYALLPVSVLIALVWLMGAGFATNNTLEALDASLGQIVKSGCYMLGSTYLLYELGQLFYCFLEKSGWQEQSDRETGKLLRLYQKHPFLVPFCLILLCWLPHLIIAYPGYICYDAWNQLAQFFGKYPFTTHHPPVHTVVLGSFVQLGLNFGSANIGIYLSVVVQTIMAALVFAYSFFIMQNWGSPKWLQVLTFCLVTVVPYYTNYIGLVMKDTSFAVCFLLFVAEVICMMEKEIDYFGERKHKVLFILSVMGTILFRNNGKYVLYPTILMLLVYFGIKWRRRISRIDFIKLLGCFVIPILLANILTMAVTTRYAIQKGSIREALSLPFQQTARYVKERKNEVTAEEEEAIRAVLDYDHLAEKYNSRLADPVKATYKDEASREELLKYLSVWVKMFFKHPEVYVKATINQNYYLLYPFIENITELDVIYPYTLPSNAYWYIEQINDRLDIKEVEALQKPKRTIEGSYRALFSMPVIGLFCHQATYCILLLFLIVFAVKKSLLRWLIVAFPLVLSGAVVIFAPVIQFHPRYAFPIIYTIPIMLAYYVHLGKSARAGTPTVGR